MKQFIKTILNKVILVCVFASLFQGCNSDDGAVSCVPNPIVNVTINTSLPLYSNLNNPGGWVYVSTVTAGSKGMTRSSRHQHRKPLPLRCHSAFAP